MSVHELNPQYARVMSQRVTIRYVLMFMHRRDLAQSSVSRTRFHERQGVGMQCQTSSLHSTGKQIPQ